MRTVTLDAAASEEANAHLSAMLRALQDGLREVLTYGAKEARRRETLWARLDEAFDAYGLYLAHVVSAHPMSCHSGCDSCCHDNPRGVTWIELLRLARWLELNGVDAAAPLHDARVYYDGWLAARGGEGSRAINDPVMRACPLLGDDGRCSVYPARPVACRMFHAQTPADWCHPDSPHFTERINPHLVPHAMCMQLLGAISHALGLPKETTLWQGLDAALNAEG